MLELRIIIRNSDIDRLRGLFAKRLIATMDMLKKTVGTVADLTVFRKLVRTQKVPSLSSPATPGKGPSPEARPAPFSSLRRDDGARGTSDGSRARFPPSLFARCPVVRNCDRLSAEELWRFHNDGFVVPDCRLPQDVVAEMREAYDSALLK